MIQSIRNWLIIITFKWSNWEKRFNVFHHLLVHCLELSGEEAMTKPKKEENPLLILKSFIKNTATHYYILNNYYLYRLLLFKYMMMKVNYRIDLEAEQSDGSIQYKCWRSKDLFWIQTLYSFWSSVYWKEWTW